VKNLLILLGKRVHELRAAKGWSQEEFAHVSGLHRTYVGQIERGEKNISFGNLSKISGVLGVTLSELLSGLEDGLGATVTKVNRRNRSNFESVELQKLARRLRLQGSAMDRTISALEELSDRRAQTSRSRAGGSRQRVNRNRNDGQ
jgi:transcriptional regulator with XRE-family HTH domain